MKKIVFGITSLRLGGAERVLVDLVNKLSSRYEITIFTLYGKGEFIKQLDNSVRVVSVYDEAYESLSFWQRKKISVEMLVKCFRKKIYDKFIRDNFDVEVAFLEGPMTWIFGFKSSARKVAWVHNDIEDVFGSSLMSKVKQKMNKNVYSLYDCLVFVSQANLDKFVSYFPENNVCKKVVYNYLDQGLVLKKSQQDHIMLESPSFLQVSRLVEQKAVERLIDVHNSLIRDGFKHHVYVVGDGPLRKALEEKVEKLNLCDTFHLLGGKENPYPFIAACDIFMLTSYYEGYPMVLLEGKALGKYILLTDSAARETLVNYDDKMIVENSEQGIYEGIKNVLKSNAKSKSVVEDSNDGLLELVCEVLEGEI